MTSSNYLATKVAIPGDFSGISLLVPAGVVAYTATFAVTDIISEVYGKKAAIHVVFVGFIIQLLIPLYSFTAMILPIASFQEEYAELFNKVFSVALNIVIESY